MHQATNWAHRVVANRVVALGRIADQLSSVRHELACDRVGGIAGPDERGKRRRDGDRVARGDRLELREPFRRGEPRFDERSGGGQTVRRSLDGHASGWFRQRICSAPAGADGGGRTRTALRPRDFKSLASTGFATSARQSFQMFTNIERHITVGV